MNSFTTLTPFRATLVIVSFVMLAFALQSAGNVNLSASELSISDELNGFVATADDTMSSEDPSDNGRETSIKTLIANNAIIPPVILLDFQARQFINEVLLSWTTASEGNNDKFIVQRSIDGQKWEDITALKGEMNSTELKQYRFQDILPADFKTKAIYYRLGQVDTKGSIVFSEVSKVDYNSSLYEDKVYYNKSKNVETASIDVMTSSNANVMLMTPSGKVLFECNINVERENKISIPAQNLNYGTYSVVITNNGNIKSYKVMKY